MHAVTDLYCCSLRKPRNGSWNGAPPTPSHISYSPGSIHLYSSVIIAATAVCSQLDLVLARPAAEAFVQPDIAIIKENLISR